MKSREDALVLAVVVRELEAIAAAEKNPFGPLQMMAGLLRTLEDEALELPATPDRSIQASDLKAYLTEKGLADAESSVKVLRSALGFSKDTFLITVGGAAGGSKTFVIRRDVPAGTTRTTVLDEYPLLEELHRRGFPVAPPVLVEPEPPPALGKPFMLSAGMPGEPGVFGGTTDAGIKAQAAEQLATFLARLHRTSLDDLPVRRVLPRGDDTAELRGYIAEWKRLWEECAPGRDRDLVHGFEALEESVPENRRLSLIHSDVGFHNILVQDGSITAVLDWEFAHIGEPEEDLAYARSSVEELVPWDEFLKMYVDAGAEAPSQERLQAYGVWRGLRNATCCAVGRKAFEAGLSTDLRLAYAGRVILEQSVTAARESMV